MWVWAHLRDTCGVWVTSRILDMGRRWTINCHLSLTLVTLFLAVHSYLPSWTSFCELLHYNSDWTALILIVLFGRVWLQLKTNDNWWLIFSPYPRFMKLPTHHACLLGVPTPTFLLIFFQQWSIGYWLTYQTDRVTDTTTTREACTSKNNWESRSDFSDQTSFNSPHLHPGAKEVAG